MGEFKKGMKVDKYLSGAGVTTSEKATVLRVDKKGVWLNNGSGNDPSGPFCPISGKYLEWSLPGWESFIQPIVTGETP